VFVLLRHANAGDKKAWHAPDTERPLSRHGRQQAEGVARTLAGVPITRLVSSPYLRCQETLVPLAASTGLGVELSDLLVPDASPAAVDEMLSDPAVRGSVLCTHGETIAALLRRWHRRGTVRIPLRKRDITKSATSKGAGWVVEETSSGLTCHYLRPVRILDAPAEHEHFGAGVAHAATADRA
jgi:phosphohistidine phosphatase SixA